MSRDMECTCDKGRPRAASSSFHASAGPALIAALDREAGAVYALDQALTIQFVNVAWTSFAEANGGADSVVHFGLGSALRAVVPDVLWPLYESAFAAVFATGRPWNHIYECSAPTQLRSYRMRVVRLPDRRHLIVSNDLVRQTDAMSGPPAVASDYVGEDGIVVQCAHCRRVRRAKDEIWDWVPNYVVTPHPQLSHGLCAPCLEYHYGTF